jgi:putative transcriptional regulator
VKTRATRARLGVLHRVGVFDKATMREFDTSCLTTAEPLSAKEILKIRELEGVSQGVFARYLNVKPKLVSNGSEGRKSRAGLPSSFSPS